MSVCNDVKSVEMSNDRNVHFKGTEVDEVVAVKSMSILEATPISTDERSISRILIKGGQVVNDDTMSLKDVYIEDGIIKNLGLNLQVPGGTKIIDATKKMVIPGGIDTHTHFEMPFMGTVSCDDFYSGTRAALFGGTTMIMDFAIDKEGNLLKTYDDYRKKADGKVCCDYSLHVGISKVTNETQEEISVLAKEKGVNSFKCFMCYDDLEMSDAELLTVFDFAKKEGCLIQIHAENGSIIRFNQKKLLDAGITGPEGHCYSRTEEVEAEATHRAITLASQINCPVYIVHVMSKSAGDIIAQHKQKGCAVYGEVIAAAIGADGSNYFHHCWRHAAGFILSPPLNTDPTTSTHLLELLSSGSLQTSGSDNCTFSAAQKELGKDDFSKIPNGVNGVEDRMSVLWEKGVMTGILNPMQFVASTSSNAAKIFNIYPQKGRIQPGSDADIVVWDPYATRKISAKTHQQAVDFNIFEGMEVRGVPLYVIARGKVVIGDGQIQVTQGAGHFIPNPPFSPYIYSSLQQRQTYPDPVIRKDIQLSDGKIIDSPASPSVANESIGSLIKATCSLQFHSRPPTKSGGRNLQDSSFSLSGAQIDDSKGQRLCVRVNNPPGGQSSGLW